MFRFMAQDSEYRCTERRNFHAGTSTSRDEKGTISCICLGYDKKKLWKFFYVSKTTIQGIKEVMKIFYDLKITIQRK